MLFTKRQIVNIAVPLFIQYMLGMLVGIVDTMMVSSAGEATVSGVSLVNSLDSMLVMVFASLVTGGSVVVAQMIGARELPRAQSAAKQLLYASTIVATLIGAMMLIGGRGMLSLLFGQVERDVMQSANAYLIYIAISYPFLAIFNSAASLFRVMGNSKVTMVVSLGLNVINVAGNAILIYGLGMGAAGAAIATLIARAVGAIILLVLLHSRENLIYLERLFSYRPDFGVIREILRIGVPNGIENSMFHLGKLLTQALVSSLGTGAIAAVAVANNLVSLQYMPGNVVSDTMVTVVGRCVGAREKEQAKKYARALMLVTYGSIWIVALLTSVFVRPLIGLYSLSGEAAEVARTMLLYHAVFACLIWPMAFTLPATFRAASDVKFPMMVSLMSMWIFRVALSYLLAPEQFVLFGLRIPAMGLGPLGVWLAMFVDWAFRALLFVPRFLRGKWLEVYDRVHGT